MVFMGRGKGTRLLEALSFLQVCDKKLLQRCSWGSPCLRHHQVKSAPHHRRLGVLLRAGETRDSLGSRKAAWLNPANLWALSRGFIEVFSVCL